jgi:hypothetical protein
MPTIIVSIENSDYTMRVCNEVDFDELDDLIESNRFEMEENGEAVNVLRSGVISLEECPNLPLLIDKRLNITKLAQTQFQHYKVVKMLYKAVIKNKDLARLLPQFKNKHKELFNNKLELMEEATNKGWCDDGVYLDMVNNAKTTYDSFMSQYDIFEKLITNPSALCVE